MGTKDCGFAHHHHTTILDIYTKNIVKTAHLWRIHIHKSILYPNSYAISKRIYEPKFAKEENLSSANLYINHYIIQSYDRFKSVKMNRGDVSHKSFEKALKTEDYFNHYDFNEIEDKQLYDLYYNK